MTARELRVWHWRRALEARARAQKNEAEALKLPMNAKYHAQQAKTQHNRANFHIKAVQVLNDYPGLQDSTVEQDAKV